MGKGKKNYFRAEGTHENYIIKARLCFLMLLFAWIYTYWGTIVVTISLYRYSPAGAHNSLLLIPAAWLLIYELRHPNFLVPRFNYIGALLVIATITIWIYARVTGIHGLEYLMVYLMLPCMLITCMGINIAANNMVPISLWLLSFPMGHWLLQYIPMYLGDVLGLIKKLLESTISDGLLGAGQKKIMYIFWGSIQYMPISFAIILLYSNCKFKLHAMGQFFLLLATSMLTFFLFLIFSMIFSSISIESRVYLQIASFMTISAVTIIAIWYGHKLHLNDYTAGINISWSEEGSMVSYSWFRKSMIMAIFILSGPWIAENISDNSWIHKDINIQLPEKINSWEKNK
ncbi:MAG: hypothetical protein HON32_01680 [Francisellaceae bacterium]|jgi:hypothetical protein|nr:hypothetical protein [Francisellaceae bacterium]MBT6538954.1 hypothetical protein [Francisellaceae bacterium]